MSEMKGIDIEVDSATAWVEAGVAVKELDDVTCPLDLAAVNGSCTDVGVIGLILGGGVGFLSRTKGLAIDNCLQIEIVTATGNGLSPHHKATSSSFGHYEELDISDLAWLSKCKSNYTNKNCTKNI